MTLEGAGQSLESGETVFAGGGQVATQGAKSLGAAHGAKSAGDFLLEFDHANVAFGEIVVELPLPQDGIPPCKQLK